MAEASVLLVLGTSTGGVCRHVGAVARGLAEAGHVVVVAGPASTRGAIDVAGTIDPAAGARFAAVEVSELPRPVHDAVTVARLRRLARGARVVHAHGLRAGALTVLAVCGLRRRPAVVVTLHNALVVEDGFGGALGRGVVSGVYAVLERVVARRADVVLGVSGDLEQRMRDLGAARVGHAVVPAPPGRPATRPGREVRTALGVGQDAELLVSVARLAPQKGLGLLLDTVAELRRDPARARVVAVVAGEGPLRPELSARIRAEGLPVRLLGHRDDVPELFAASDVAVLTSVWEGQPLTVQEALRAGTALVATDVGGTAEVAGDAVLLVPYGDPGALAGAVSSLLDDPQRREQLSRAALDRARQLPTDDDAVEQLLGVYRSVRPDC